MSKARAHGFAGAVDSEYMRREIVGGRRALNVIS
jgi:hypothetical protein